MADLYHFRNLELDSDLAYKLAPFVYAYRPHTNPDGSLVEPISQESPCNLRDLAEQAKSMDE
jgi:hypothetical protein